jgi:hypothetical protein
MIVARNRQSMTPAVLRAVLIARCAASIIFVAWMSAVPDSFAAILVPFGWFAAIDGVLALMMAALALRIPQLRRGFALVAGLDGLWLVAAAAALRLGPGIPDFGLTLVLYIGLAAVCALFVGLLKITSARRLGQETQQHALRAALTVAGIASAAFGIGAFFMRPSAELMRQLLMAAAAIEGLALLAVALRRWTVRTHAMPAH